MKKYVGELVGTFILVFCGTGAMVIDQQTGGAVSHVGVAITWGLIVMSLINSLGNVSGCHINPAVSIAFTLAGRFKARLLPGYIVSQLAGALLASFILRVLFSHQSVIGCNHAHRYRRAIFCVRTDTHLYFNAGYYARSAW